MSNDRLLTDEEMILDICTDCTGELYLRDMDCKACHRNMATLARLAREHTAREILQMAKDWENLTQAAWSDKYGDITDPRAPGWDNELRDFIAARYLPVAHPQQTCWFNGPVTLKKSSPKPNENSHELP